MTWEDVIISAREKPEYQEVIHQSYLEENLVENVERFHSSEEFIETLRLIEQQGKPSDLKLLDIGCGNGISTVSFAIQGYKVSAIEPDPSYTVGRGAIGKLSDNFGLDIQIIDGVGEKIPLVDNCFDIVYARQTLHHSSDLGDFIKECFRVLKKGGIIFTARDHVIYGQKDKEWFLKSHPFHRFYGGENAFKRNEYTRAFRRAGFQLISTLKHYDSVINYFPLSKKDYYDYPAKMKITLRNKLIEKLGFPGKASIIQWIFRCHKGLFPSWYNEKLIAGRLYSFIAVKP
jgi:SAM-dependent methyltransferase